MTGFGRGEQANDGLKATVEIKSVNNRYSDITIRMPQSLRHIESDLQDLVRNHVDRGKLNISIKVERQDSAELDIAIDPKVVKSYRNLLQQLKESTGIEDPIRLEHLLSFNELFVTKEEDEQELEIMGDVVRKATVKALDQLKQMREQEGSHLAEDLAMRLENMEVSLEKIERRSAERIPEARNRLHERIQNLVGEEKFDPERLELEIALLADKLDITEEIVRLKAHFKFFREAMKQEGTVGRKLNFLSQEMNREINTIGSKSNDSEIAHDVVELKEILEKIREQIQNIE